MAWPDADDRNRNRAVYWDAQKSHFQPLVHCTAQSLGPGCMRLGTGRVKNQQGWETWSIERGIMSVPKAYPEHTLREITDLTLNATKEKA